MAKVLRENIEFLKGMGPFRPNFQVESDVHQQLFLHG